MHFNHSRVNVVLVVLAIVIDDGTMMIHVVPVSYSFIAVAVEIKTTSKISNTVWSSVVSAM